MTEPYDPAHGVSGQPYAAPAGADEIPTDLPDLSEVDLSELRDRAGPVLAAALARVAEQALSDEQVVAGFNSAI